MLRDFQKIEHPVKYNDNHCAWYSIIPELCRTWTQMLSDQITERWQQAERHLGG